MQIHRKSNVKNVKKATIPVFKRKPLRRLLP
jgi:hypothetical protein